MRGMVSHGGGDVYGGVEVVKNESEAESWPSPSRMHLGHVFISPTSLRSTRTLLCSSPCVSRCRAHRDMRGTVSHGRGDVYGGVEEVKNEDMVGPESYAFGTRFHLFHLAPVDAHPAM